MFQSIAADKENIGKVVNISGRLPYANGSQCQEEEAAEWKRKPESPKFPH
jgi:hypothetical protein